MTPFDLSLLFVLAAIWGASFLFIKVAVEEMSPMMLVAIRLVLASLVLLPLQKVSRLAGPADKLSPPWTSLWRSYLFVAVVNSVLPYVLIAWSEERIASGTTSILNATTPLFTAVLAATVVGGVARERLAPMGLLGLLVGFAGVAVISLGGGVEGGTGRSAILGYGAVLLASFTYGVGGLYARRAFVDVPPVRPALWQNVLGAGLLLPVAWLLTPLDGLPSLQASASVLALGVLGTGVALVLYYELLARVGATRTVMVTYLLPVMALVYGALLLGERVGWHSIVGLAFVLLGVMLTARARGVRDAPTKQRVEIG